MSLQMSYLGLPDQERLFIKQGLVRLGLSSLAAYRRTSHWRSFARRVRLNFCEQCFYRPVPKKRGRKLHVHHLTYIRIGRERDSDVRTLCELCHRQAHGISRRRRSRKKKR